MTKRNNLTVALILLALLVLTAAPAAAQKEGRGPPDKDPEPSGANTCVSPWWNGGDDDFASSRDDGGSFTIPLSKDNPNACVDVLTEYAGRWFVTVELVKGSWPRGLTIVPRDGVAPGDTCGGVSLRGEAIHQRPIPLPYFEDLNGNGVQDPGEPGDPRGFMEIPAATVNACRGNAPVGEPGEFDETLEWASDVDKAVFNSVLESSDPVDETATEFNVMEARPDEIHPLALQIFSQGLRKHDVIKITVTLPTGP